MTDRRAAPALRRRTLVVGGATAAWAAPLVVTSVPAYAAACSGGPTPTLSVAMVFPSGATVDANAFTIMASIQVCATGAAASSLGATVTVSAAATQVTDLQVGTWPAASAPAGTDSLSAVAPVGTTIAAGTCVTLSTQIRVAPYTEFSAVTLTFTSACGGEGHTDIHFTDFGGG